MSPLFHLSHEKKYYLAMYVDDNFQKSWDKEIELNDLHFMLSNNLPALT